MNRKITYGLLTILLLGGLYFGLRLGFGYLESSPKSKLTERVKFNSDEWLRGDRRTRGKMVDNIIKDSILIGKSKGEVLNLLGELGDTSGNFSYQVDIGLKTGPLGLGGVWLFDLNIYFDTLTRKVFEVRCND